MKDNYYLYVGNAYPHKNLDVLIRAAALARDIRLVFVGKDDYFYRRLKQSEAVKSLGNRITFKTNVSDKALHGLYRSARAFVFPSLMEGFGLPALEALENGCPVVVSDIPVFHEILGDAAVYFDPHDASALTNILTSKIDKPKKLTKSYSWEKMAKETLSVYENCYRLRPGK